MDNYFACALKEEELKKRAKSDKHISSSLDNLSGLNDEEYLNLLSFFLSESTAGYMPWRYIGIDYTILMYELDPERFSNKFAEALLKSHDVDDKYFYDDFYDLEGWLRIINADIYKQFMEISSRSVFDDVRKDAKKWLTAPPEPDTNSRYYRYHIEEYAEFKRRLGII